jgi:flagellin
MENIVVSPVNTTGSINTNYGAQVALSNLHSVGNQLTSIQKEIATGYKVADPYDDGASYAVAQGLRGTVNALTAVNERLNVGQGLVAVAVSAGENISSSLLQIQSVLTKLADQSLTGSDRSNYEAQYNTLRADVLSFIQDASFNGINIINNQSATNPSYGNQSVISNVAGGSYTIKAQDLYNNVYKLLTNVTGSYSSAGSLIASTGGFQNALTNLGLALNQLSADSRRITNQINFNNAISDATTTGLGAIVDADLSKASAQLTALQTKQQLSTQALSIANQSPQSILSLFR